MDTNGIITTIAGTAGTAGFSGDGGAATSAKLNYPTRLEFASINGVDIFIEESIGTGVWTSFPSDECVNN